jgi:hypothetical protein
MSTVPKYITKFKDVVTDNPTKQVWKLLRYFLDENTTAERIQKLHDTPSEVVKKQKVNIKKQAKQIGYCILQAEEYFKASSQVTVATRPLLLYYGAVSLAQALILLKRDGLWSFDGNSSNVENYKHHGLELIGDITVLKHNLSTASDFFNHLICKIHMKDSKPWGHFPVFYESLTAQPIAFKTVARIVGKDAFHFSDELFQADNVMPLDKVKVQTFDVLSLFKELPDLFSDLQALGVEPGLVKGLIDAKGNNFTEDQNGELVITDREWKLDFYLYGLTKPQKEFFQTEFKKQHVSISEFGNEMRITTSFDLKGASQFNLEAYFVDDLSGNPFFGTNNDTLPETASMFAILYCLGMLSRYYPHVWMKAINENIQVAELTDSFLNIVYRKFPNLILDQMTLVKHHIHI